MIVKIPKAERYECYGIILDHFHRCNECEAESSVEDCV
ncbi:hypothetical protein LCGC14_1575820, partial [marine sediment metagenome]